MPKSTAVTISDVIFVNIYILHYDGHVTQILSPDRPVALFTVNKSTWYCLYGGFLCPFPVYLFDHCGFNVNIKMSLPPPVESWREHS